MIMEYVGCQSQTDEVLNCRLVARTWNEMALVVLKDKGYTIAAGRETLQPEEMILVEEGLYKSRFGDRDRRITENLQEFEDICSNKDLTTISAYKKLGLKLGFDIHDNVPIIKSLDQLPNVFLTSIIFDSFVKPVSGFPGQEIVGLDLSSFWNLLKNCSSTLRYFEYCTKLYRLPYFSKPNRELISSASEIFQDTRFPEIQSVYFDLRRHEVQAMLTPLSHLINNSPKLRKLQLFDSAPFEVWNRMNQVGLICHRLVSQLSAEAKNRIQDLEIPLLPFRMKMKGKRSSHPSDPAPNELFSNFVFKNLNRLKTHISINNLCSQTFLEAYRACLENNFPALTSYEFDCLEMDITDVISMPLMLPHSFLSRIKCIGLYGLDFFGLGNQYDVNVAVKRLLFELASKCTSLKYCKADLMSCFNMVEARLGSPYHILNQDQLEFTSVETLHVTGICDTSNTFMFINELLAQVFTNLKRIIFDPDLVYAGDVIRFGESVLLDMFTSPARGLESLEFTNYFENWVGTKLFKNSDISKNLVHLGLKFNAKECLHIAPDQLKVQDLSDIVSSCPKLTLLEVSSKLVVSNEGKRDFETMLPQLNNLRAQLPQVEIRLI